MFVRSSSERLGADPGQVSYHLRELARRGFVEDVPEMARDRRSEDWRRAVMSSESFLRLTPDEPAELTAELQSVLMRSSEATRGRSREDGREPVSVFFHAFPERDS